MSLPVDWSQVGGVATAAGVIIGGLFRLWGAIKNRFTAVEETRTRQVMDLKGHMDATFAKHEQLDQSRHEENIERFQAINLTLARNGINGGHHQERRHS